MTNATFYVIDTSALIKMNYRYPIPLFKSLWGECNGLIDEGRLGAPATVHEEIKKKDDDLRKWVKKCQDDLFYDELPFIEYQQDILSKFPGLVDPRRQYDQADPFVIAMALERIAKPTLVYQDVCIVTEEETQIPDQRRVRVRISEVCNHYGICCIRVLDMIKKEMWVF